MKFVYMALMLAVLMLGLKLFSSEGGLVDYWQTKDSLQALEQENTQQEKTNLQLKKQVYALQHHPEAIETLARQKLGMIGEDEIFIQVIDVPAPLKRSDSPNSPSMQAETISQQAETKQP